jgi:acetyl-CoA carboxylase carboxyl transferase subunit alpha
MMFENSVYAILSPEGFASILYKDSKRAKEAAEIMKITAKDLKELGIIDEIIKEGQGLHIDPEIGISQLKMSLIDALKRLSRKPIRRKLISRYQKFRQIGLYVEGEEDESTN